MQVYDKQRVAALEVALSGLSARTRSVFVLRRVYGYSYLEIAAQMGMSERAVEKHLVRAMAHCQQAYRFDDSDMTDGVIKSDDRSATLWSTYHFQEGLLQGFGVGGGVFGYTNRNASIFGPQVTVPGYVRVDAALYYNHDLAAGNWLRAKQINFALNVRNLLDQHYVEGADNSTTSFYFGQPSTILGTVGLKF